MPLSQLGLSLVSVASPALSLVTLLSSQNLRETRQSNHRGDWDCWYLCVTTPSLNINRFRIKSATASRVTVTGDCLSDHNGVVSFSSWWWEAGGDYKFIGGRNSRGWRNLVTMGNHRDDMIITWAYSHSGDDNNPSLSLWWAECMEGGGAPFYAYCVWDCVRRRCRDKEEQKILVSSS